MTRRDAATERAALELVERALEVGRADRRAFIEKEGAASSVRARAIEILFDSGPNQIALATGGADAFARTLAEPPKRVGSYRILKEIGRGGMGAVYLAERATRDFDHEVAVKVIAAGKLSSTLIERFERERQTLAQLNHPNIARLYDGGETDDGLPYLVMELVKGRPLDHWLEDSPSQAERFSVLDQILAAVDHAHRNLIIHRDLTPSNVIVSDEGVVKLIDFGISSFQSASQISGSKTPGISGQTATPGYAAPESKTDVLPSTALDIFALGKLMNALFQPFERPDLAAISDKASAPGPGERYTSVRALGEDVQRYQTDRPVDAFSGGYGYRVGKYLRRNWLPIGAASAIVATVGVSVGLLASAYTQEQSARQLADSRFEDVRALASTMMFDVYDAIDAIPNTVEARQLIARSSINYLNNLAITPDAPADLRREVGEGWLRLSQVTGGSSGDHIGLPEDALSFGARAIDVLESLHKDYPEDEETQTSLGRALAILALDSLYMDGDSDTGYARAQRAVALLSPLEPSNERVASATARAYRALGDAYGWQNELPKAGAVYGDGLAFVRALPEALQDSMAMRLEMPSLMRQRAEVYRFTGEPEKALTQMRETVAYNQSTFERAAPEDAATVRRNLVISLWNISDMSVSAQQWEDGLTYAERGHTLIQTALDANPNDIGWLEMIPQINVVIARLHSGRLDHVTAVKAAEIAIDTVRTIRAKSGANAGADLTLAVSLKDLAPVYHSAGDSVAACSGLQESYSILSAYDEAGALSQYDRDNNLLVVKDALNEC